MINLDQMQIIDISPRINSKIAVFPGDTPFEHEVVMDMKKGQNITLSWTKSTVHLGAHADAPNHYSKDGVGIAQRDLGIYMGAVQIIEVVTRRGQRVRPQDLPAGPIQAPRVLFKTMSFPDPYRWNGDFMSLSSELVEELARQGVRLVGIDTPSIDLADDKILESHSAVARNDMAILEGLVLNDVSGGLYQLIALPLPYEGLDATPVRAVLLKPKELR